MKIEEKNGEEVELRVEDEEAELVAALRLDDEVERPVAVEIENEMSASENEVEADVVEAELDERARARGFSRAYHETERVHGCHLIDLALRFVHLDLMYRFALLVVEFESRTADIRLEEEQMHAFLALVWLCERQKRFELLWRRLEY